MIDCANQPYTVAAVEAQQPGALALYCGFWNTSMCIGENTPVFPPATRLRATFLNMLWTCLSPLGASHKASRVLTATWLTYSSISSGGGSGSSIR